MATTPAPEPAPEPEAAPEAQAAPPADIPDSSQTCGQFPADEVAATFEPPPPAPPEG